MYLVQTLYWLHDTMQSDVERSKLDRTIRKLLADKKGGSRLTEDLRLGLSAMPIWMQDILRNPISTAEIGMEK